MYTGYINRKANEVAYTVVWLRKRFKVCPIFENLMNANIL